MKSAIIQLLALHLVGLGSCVYTAAADAPSSGTDPALRLTGIVFIGDYKRAYVRHEQRGAAPEYFTLREGESVRGWELRRVNAEAGEIHVVRNGKEIRLSLDSQQLTERRERAAEQQFVHEHTRGQEEYQRRERERLARESQ